MNSEMTKLPPPEEVFSDPTPDGIIQHRFSLTFTQLLEYVDIDEHHKGLFFSSVTSFCRKLASVWRAARRYEQTEDAMIRRVSSPDFSFGSKIMSDDTGRDLMADFDYFLSSSKSTLDYLVQIPCSILGRKVWSVYTFGEGGKKVKKTITQCLPKQYSHYIKERLPFVFNDNVDSWLSLVKSLRDKFEHCIDGGVNPKAFYIWKSGTLDDVTLHVPLFDKGVAIRSVMNLYWDNLFQFSERFIAFFVFMRLKPEFQVSQIVPSSLNIRDVFQVTLRKMDLKIYPLHG